MQNINWSQVLVFGLVVLVVFVLGLGVLFLFFGGGFGMMGPRVMGGRWCPWCGGTGHMGGGLLGLTLICLLPLGALLLLILGGIWLARNAGQRVSSPGSLPTACPNCNRAVEPDWRNCPYCGEDLQNE